MLRKTSSHIGVCRYIYIYKNSFNSSKLELSEQCIDIKTPFSAFLVKTSGNYVHRKRKFTIVNMAKGKVSKSE